MVYTTVDQVAARAMSLGRGSYLPRSMSSQHIDLYPFAQEIAST